MNAFRALLVVLFLAMIGYTTVTMANHGANLFPQFFGDMIEMGWPGQFNFDFMLMLFFSANWVMWRNHYTGGGLALGVVAFFGGAIFLSAYLFILFGQTRNVTEVLVGPRRAGAN